MNYSPLKSTRLNISLKMRRKSESIPKCLGLWRSGQEGRCRPWHCDRKSCWEPRRGPREDYKCNVLLYFFACLLWKSQKLKLIILRFAAIATKRCATEIVWSSITSCMRWCGFMMTCCYIRWCDLFVVVAVISGDVMLPERQNHLLDSLSQGSKMAFNMHRHLIFRKFPPHVFLIDIQYCAEKNK